MKKIFLLTICALGLSLSVFSQQGDVVKLNKADFITKVFNYEKYKDKWVYEGTKPCIIDFYADWCAPCKKVAPILAELAEKYKGQIIIYKIDTDKERELAQAFGISSIPTLFFVPAEGTPQAIRGAISKEDFEKMIKQVLLK